MDAKTAGYKTGSGVSRGTASDPGPPPHRPASAAAPRIRHSHENCRLVCEAPCENGEPSNRHSAPSVIPVKQGVSKHHPREATTPRIVIPAKAGIQGRWRGVAACWPRPHHPWIPAFAGMTEGPFAPRSWPFDTPCFAGMTEGCGNDGLGTSLPFPTTRYRNFRATSWPLRRGAPGAAERGAGKYGAPVSRCSPPASATAGWCRRSSRRSPLPWSPWCGAAADGCWRSRRDDPAAAT